MMRKYDDEFKRQAVKKILDGQSVASVSRELGVAEGILHNWKKAKLAKSYSSEQEVVELRKRLKEVEMENEILKKAALIFGRGS
jgi:transposase